MDNEAPNYASWVPEAGGYVANGKVVSKSPIYDEAGKLKLDVDTAVFGNTQSTTSKNQPQVANQPITNNGITTANTTGSGTDANAPITQAGSLTTLENNLGKAQDSAISSPATRSIVAGDTIVSPEDEVNQEYQQAVARGDLQGQINALVRASRLTGQDYSAEIENLTKQRQQKIQGMDDSYLQRINDAKQKVANAKAMADISGKEADKQAYYQALDELNTLQGEQNTWRNAVGYQDAMRDMYNQEIQDLQIDYEDTWLKSVKAFGDQLVQMIPALMNFQYDPMQDSNLMRAQSMVEARMRNNAAATGMYYSSTTQYAIAQAIGELIPVYQKMAREEAIENFKLLQSTASFLMDLEEQQFNMWKSQIQMKWAANDEKRKAVDQAVQNANARGYYTNEEAALLGVAPGAESQAARERALDKQEQIEKEARNLKQSMALAKYNAELEAQLTEEKAKITAKYTTNNTPNNTNPATKYMGMTPAQWKTYAKDYVANGGDIGKIEEELENSGFSEAQINSIIEGAKGKETTSIVNEDGTINWEGDTFPGTMTSSKLQEEIEQVAEAGEMTAEDKALRIENAVLNAKSWDEAWNAISTATTESGGAKSKIFDSELIKNLTGSSKDKLLALDEYYTLLAVAEQQGHNVYEDIAAARDRGAITPQLANQFIKAYTKNNLLSDVSFTDNASRNESTIGRAVRDIKNSTPYLSQDQVVAAYKELFDNIVGAGSKNKPFRYDKTYVEENNVLTSKGKNSYDFDAGISGNQEKCKERAILDVLQDIYNSNEFGDKEKKGYIMKKLTEYLRDKANDELSDGYKFLKDNKYYVLKLD